MTREQRFRYEMFVRVRDYGTAHENLFPESSTGGQTFAQVAAAVAAIDEHLKARVVGRADAQRVKAATRAAVFEGMKAIALAARRVTRPEPGENPFRMPRRRSLTVEISTARAFIEEVGQRQDQFARFGLPSAFIGEFEALVDRLQQAVDVRLSSKTVKREAQVGIETQFARGFDACLDLDAVVTIAIRRDPARLAAWRAARRVEGQRSSRSTKVAKPAIEPEAPSSEPPQVEAPASTLPAGKTGDMLGKAS